MVGIDLSPYVDRFLAELGGYSWQETGKTNPTAGSRSPRAVPTAATIERRLRVCMSSHLLILARLVALTHTAKGQESSRLQSLAGHTGQ